MSTCVRLLSFCFAVFIALAIGGGAQAQALASQAPLPQPRDVAQFGMPADAKFVFCTTHDCPERSLKHLATPMPSPSSPQKASIASLQTRVAAISDVPRPEAFAANNEVPPDKPSAKPPSKARAKVPAKRIHRKDPFRSSVDVECKPPGRMPASPR